MQFLKNIIRILVNKAFSLFLSSKIGMQMNDIAIKNVMKRVEEINYNNLTLKFTVPNNLNKFRVKTFSTKEPETLDWIDNFENNSVFWDIGSNIGLYTCYAAKKKNCKVFSFEPSIFNLELLARNININNLEKMVTLIPIPLNEKVEINNFNMSNRDWGGALSTFGKEYTHDGTNIKSNFSYSTLGISMDDAIDFMNLPYPKYIKIDVDGIEHLILKGASKTLKKVSSLLIEVDDKFNKQKLDCKSYLENSGFILKGKYQSPLFDNTKLSSSFNQIWSKKSLN